MFKPSEQIGLAAIPVFCISNVNHDAMIKGLWWPSREALSGAQQQWAVTWESYFVEWEGFTQRHLLLLLELTYAQIFALERRLACWILESASSLLQLENNTGADFMSRTSALFTPDLAAPLGQVYHLPNYSVAVIGRACGLTMWILGTAYHSRTMGKLRHSKFKYLRIWYL